MCGSEKECRLPSRTWIIGLLFGWLSAPPFCSFSPENETFRVTASGRAPAHEGGLQRRLPRLHVALDMDRRNAQRRRSRVEAIGGVVLRQQVLQRRRDAEQIADGVLILQPVQAADARAPFAAPRLRFRGERDLRPVQRACECGFRWARILWRRHLARLQPFAAAGVVSSSGRLSTRKFLFCVVSSWHSEQCRFRKSLGVVADHPGP